MTFCITCKRDTPPEGFYSGYVDRGDCRCKECVKAAARAWRANNPRRVVEYRAEYQEQHPDRTKAQAAKTYQRNKPKALAASNKWAAKNRVKSRDIKRRSAARPEAKVVRQLWHAENKQKLLVVKRQWAARNRHLGRAKQAEYVAAKSKRFAAWDRSFTSFVLREAADLCQRREAATGFKWEVDHEIPLRGRTVSGLHVWNNLRVIPLATNRSKRNTFEI